MRKNLFVILFVLITCMISLASAEIMLSQPKAVYTPGDEISISATLTHGGGEFKASLVCGESSKLISLKNLRSDEMSVEIFQPFTSSFLGDLTGTCYIFAEYDSESVKSQEFRISSNIKITVDIANLNYDAGDYIEINGKAEKENLEPVSGFAEVSIENTEIRLINPVTNGTFKMNFTLPENLLSGKYNLRTKVYEKDSKGDISSQGETLTAIGIKQEPKSLDIAMNEQIFSPGEEVIFKIILYDQANAEMPGEASIIIRDSLENNIFTKLAKTNEEIRFSLDTNATPGYWRIEAVSGDISTRRLFSLEEQEKAKFEIINDTLIVTNIGNVIYDKAVQVAIGGEVEIKALQLGLGESKSFRLLAPDGSYSISVTDGTTSLNELDVALTGNIIGVLDVRKQLNVWKKYPIVWLFLIMVAGLFILMLVQRTMKRKSYAYSESSEDSNPSIAPEKKAGSVPSKENIIKGESSGKKMNIDKGGEAEHTLVVGGTKVNAALVCLKIKNSLSKFSQDNLQKAFLEAYEINAVPYKSGSNVFMIFSPLITRTFQNYVPAVKTALGIAKAINEHNSKFKDKIDFGISVHSGEIVSKIESGKLKFTALGDSLTKPKRLAELSSQEVLLSKEIHEKTLSEIKAEKSQISGQDVFKVNKVTDMKKSEKFINEFLKRLNEDEKR